MPSKNGPKEVKKALDKIKEGSDVSMKDLSFSAISFFM